MLVTIREIKKVVVLSNGSREKNLKPLSEMALQASRFQISLGGPQESTQKLSKGLEIFDAVYSALQLLSWNVLAMRKVN